MLADLDNHRRRHQLAGRDLELGDRRRGRPPAAELAGIRQQARAPELAGVELDLELGDRRRDRARRPRPSPPPPAATSSPAELDLTAARQDLGDRRHGRAERAASRARRPRAAELASICARIRKQAMAPLAAGTRRPGPSSSATAAAAVLAEGKDLAQASRRGAQLVACRMWVLVNSANTVVEGRSEHHRVSVISRLWCGEVGAARSGR